jgi:hypothetical protein
VCPNTKIKFHRDIENSLFKREKKKIKQVKGKAPSYKVTLAQVAVLKD